jgi:hypothetical protein|tara:strand:+ start:391 stop:1347 length:957 start_codon:yes stop_codon:yes gene_type:complete
MEIVLAKVLQASELPGAISNQAGLAIVADNRIQQFEKFFSKLCIPHDNTSSRTKFFYNNTPIDDGEINPSWQLRGGNKGTHIQLYRWHKYYKNKGLKQNNCIAVIRPVMSQNYDFHFYVFQNNEDFSVILNGLIGTGAQFIQYQFGANKKAKMLNVNPTISQINKSQGIARKSIAGENSAIEKHAEELTKEYLKNKKFKNFQFFGKPYDILCDDGSTELRVEVKGTKGKGFKVNITRNEILHSRDECNPKHNQNTKVILSIVNDIRTQLKNKKWLASGGQVAHLDKFYFKEDITKMFHKSTIQPTQFDFKVEKHRIKI